MAKSEPAKAVFIHSPELEDFNYPSDHPFITKRAALTRQMVLSMGLLSGAELAPRPATREDLEKFHSPRYLAALQRAEQGNVEPADFFMGLGTSDCPVFKGLYDYAVLACGATLTGVELLLSGEAHVAFNPSGGYHHAGPERASGFCYVNDVALGCLALAERGKRVAYVDIDVHHGDGVQNAFYDRSDVMTISFHETGRYLFPGTGFEDEIGEGEGEGYSVNVPLPPGTYDEAYLRAFDAVAMPLVGAHAPDVIALELGMDALSGDPLAHLELTNNAHAGVVRRLLGLGKPMLVTGGGGYDPKNTARGWALAWTILCGRDSEKDGLRDRPLTPSEGDREFVEPEIDETIDKIRKSVFAIHGLS